MLFSYLEREIFIKASMILGINSAPIISFSHTLCRSFGRNEECFGEVHKWTK